MFYILPPFINMTVLALPFILIRIVSYLRWRRDESEPERVKTWTLYYQEKPEAFWFPTPVFLFIQVSWAAILLFPFQILSR